MSTPVKHRKLPIPINYKGLLVFGSIVLALGILYWPTLRWLVNSWLSSDYYSHGFLVPVISLLIIWTKREQINRIEPSFFGITWLLLGAGLYALNLFMEIRVCGPLSLISVIVGLIWCIYGLRVIKALTFPLTFLLFMVPFPFISDLAFSLQQISVLSSSRVLEILGFPITTSGAEIQLRNDVFSVGLACAGTNTLIALLALTAVYAYILKGTFTKRLCLFMLAFPIAIGANILRIVSIIIVAYFYDVETATGWYHDLSSPVFFVLAFLVVILVGHVLKCRINYGVLKKN